MLQMHKKTTPSAKKRREEKDHHKKSAFDLPGNKIHFISLGCPRNLVDTEVMLGILLRAGYEPSEELKNADYIVINTCGFLEASRTESLDTIEEALLQRKKRAKVIVTGCMVQSHSEQITKAFPQVDYLLGSGDVEGILKAVQSEEQGTHITNSRSYLEAGEIPRQLSTPKHYAYLKIAEGCRKRCAYCIIPDIKGPLKSKPIERILQEFRTLRKQGVKEIILIAQDLGDWGKDNGFKRSSGLLYLLQEILKEEGDYWLRLMYLYPDEITDELVELMKSDERICPYLDMPIQHVNDEILQSMHRATSKQQIIEIIAKLRREIPHVHIRTSLIVGFPGETEAQFQELAQFLQDYPLDNVGIFKYSQEEGSRAAAYPNQVAEEVKQQRHDQLALIQQSVVETKNSEAIGRKIDVIIEGYHPETDLLMVGRHRGQAPEIDTQVLINDGRNVTAFGERYLVEITAVAGIDLVGTALAK